MDISTGAHSGRPPGECSRAGWREGEHAEADGGTRHPGLQAQGSPSPVALRLLPRPRHLFLMPHEKIKRPGHFILVTSQAFLYLKSKVTNPFLNVTKHRVTGCPGVGLQLGRVTETQSCIRRGPGFRLRGAHASHGFPPICSQGSHQTGHLKPYRTYLCERDECPHLCPQKASSGTGLGPPGSRRPGSLQRAPRPRGR